MIEAYKVGLLGLAGAGLWFSLSRPADPAEAFRTYERFADAVAAGDCAVMREQAAGQALDAANALCRLAVRSAYGRAYAERRAGGPSARVEVVRKAETTASSPAELRLRVVEEAARPQDAVERRPQVQYVTVRRWGGHWKVASFVMR